MPDSGPLLSFGLSFTASFPQVVTPILFITRTFPRLGCLAPSTGPTATRHPSQAAYLKHKLRRHSRLSLRHQPTSESISVHAGFQVRFTVRLWCRPAVTRLIHSPSFTRPKRRGGTIVDETHRQLLLFSLLSLNT